MSKLQLNIETDYGTLTVSGDTQEEILEALSLLTDTFLDEISDKLSVLDLKQTEYRFRNIVRIGQNGPVIVTRAEISHYEAIGLVLYSMKNQEATSKQIRERLEESGKDVIVPARLNEMRKRGHVFKPSGKGSEYRLTSKGMAWIDDEVVEKIRMSG
jgi:phosphoglycerate-specific signal transduction histidine kinase